MNKFIALIATPLFVLLFLPSTASSEAWLGTRYAQHCSSCHAPSRRNVPLLKRRCTLACQGCHVNPNGGGLRSQYGIWTQQRWLRSFTSKTMGNKGTPVPLKKQYYGKQPKKLSQKKSAKKYKKYLKSGGPLRTRRSAAYNEKDHDRSDQQEKITVKNWAEFMYRIPDGDPYRLERQLGVYGGGDFRYFYLSRQIGDEDEAVAFPMALDLGLRVRPIKEHVSFVFESRTENGPNTPAMDNGVTGGTQLRSAYILVDDLPLATFFQYGIYRPLFGHYSADHYSLNQQLTFSTMVASPKSARFKAITIGGSPNVPFFNLHYITPTPSGKAANINDGQSEEGFALNLGGRWVTLGASLMASYWGTKNVHTEVEHNMFSINGGLKISRFILNGDISQVERALSGSKDKGMVTTFEGKFQLWRENYLAFNYGMTNTNVDLTKGKATEMGVGIKSFLLAGTEFELMMWNREYRNEVADPSVITKWDYIQGQFHLYF